MTLNKFMKLDEIRREIEFLEKTENKNIDVIHRIILGDLKEKLSENTEFSSIINNTHYNKVLIENPCTLRLKLIDKDYNSIDLTNSLILIKLFQEFYFNKLVNERV